MIKSLSILIVVGLFVLPSGRALKCYQCTSDWNGDCVKPKNDKLQECVLTTSTSTTTTTTTTELTTTPEGSGAGGDGSGAGGDGSGAGGEGSGAGGAWVEIVDGGEGVQVVPGDEGGEDEGALVRSAGNGGSARNPDSGSYQNGERNVVPTRVSRAILQHLSSKQVYADAEPKMVCLKRTTNTTVTRECAPETVECSGDNCYKCDSDGCNSATSVAVYASMMFGLVAFVFMIR